jgi:hypothetical protein
MRLGVFLAGVPHISLFFARCVGRWSHQTLNAIGRAVPGSPFTISTRKTTSRFFCLQSGGTVSRDLWSDRDWNFAGSGKPETAGQTKSTPINDPPCGSNARVIESLSSRRRDHAKRINFP